jgi:hypothetical protein
MFSYDGTTKPCCCCHEVKPLGEFHNQASSRDGHQAECKVCKHLRKAMKAGDTSKITRLKNGKVEEFLRGPNHGESKTPLYRRWLAMRQRCQNPTSRGYRFYGARGISVDPTWNESWPAFKEWALTHGYDEGLELDRIDPDGDYCPDNCRWLTKRDNVKRARRALPEDVDVLLQADAALRGISPEALIVQLVTDHFAHIAPDLKEVMV